MKVFNFHLQNQMKVEYFQYSKKEYFLKSISKAFQRLDNKLQYLWSLFEIIQSLAALVAEYCQVLHEIIELTRISSVNDI